MSAITLVPMTADDLDAFIAEEVADYADERVHDGTWARCEALDRARTAMATVATWERQAAASESQRLWTAVAPTGEPVGWCWVKLAPPAPRPEPARAFLCQMTVARAYRNIGYGAAMLAAIEAHLRADGIDDLYLNVHEENLPAVRLYTSAGFETVERYPTLRKLRKHLDTREPAAPPVGGSVRLVV